MSTRETLIAALMAMIAVAYLFVTKPAIAEDTGALIQRLSELVERKGAVFEELNPEVCDALGLTTAYCKTPVFQVGYRNGETDHYLHIVHAQGKPVGVSFFVFDLHIGGILFWTDLDGTLRTCVQVTGWGKARKFAKMSCQEAERNKFSSEIEYWSMHLTKLENKPDRKD